MVRVAASMLPGDDEPIVPFDRTFSGKTKSTVTGSSGRISLLDAWKTFTWPSCVRLLKVVGKIFAMEMAVLLLFCLIFATELVSLPHGFIDEILRDYGLSDMY
jgi:hypothetical protein